MTAATGTITDVRPSAGASLVRLLRRNAWVVALYGLLLVLLALAKVLRPTYGAADLQSLAIAVMPVAFAACAQTVAVISGGIDLSIGALMALANVSSAVLMVNASPEFAFVALIGVVLLVMLAGAVNGFLVVTTKVPDIVVTLAMSFVWAGAALLVLNQPGGASVAWFTALTDGTLGTEWLPRAFVVLVVVVAAVWIPLRRSRLGLSIFAVGSHQVAALRSGVNIKRTKIAAYAITGLLAAAGGLALTSITGIGSPVPGPYTLNGVAAIVLGGVSLAGGRGGMVGPIGAACVLALIRNNLIFLGVDPNVGTVIQGVLMVIVVMFGGIVTYRRARA
jgi:ribose transport system permease protein